MMHLIRQTSLWGHEQYNGWIIPRAIYRSYNRQIPGSIHTQLLAGKKRYAVLRTAEYTDSGNEIQSLEITLLNSHPVTIDVYSDISNKAAPCKNTAISMADIPVHSTLFFTMEGLKRYLLESGDTNPLHLGKPALVPGLWVLDCLRKRFSPAQGAAKLDIRFTHPVYTDQQVLLYRKRNTVIGICGFLTCFHMDIKPITTNLTK